PLLHSFPTRRSSDLTLTGLLMVLNIVGIQESSAINVFLAMLDLVTQFALVILGIWLLLHWDVVFHNIKWGIAPTWGNFLASISLDRKSTRLNSSHEW